MKLILEYPFNILLNRRSGNNLDETIDDDLKGTIIDVISKSGFSFSINDNLDNIWNKDKFSSRYQLTLIIESDIYLVDDLILALKKIDLIDYLTIYSSIENEIKIIFKSWRSYQDELRKLKSSERKKIIRKIKKLTMNEAKKYLNKKLIS